MWKLQNNTEIGINCSMKQLDQLIFIVEILNGLHFLYIKCFVT